MRQAVLQLPWITVRTAQLASWAAVRVPAGVTFVAVLLGAAWLGVVEALVAIPMAAAVQLLVQELLFPSLDEA